MPKFQTFDRILVQKVFVTGVYVYTETFSWTVYRNSPALFHSHQQLCNLTLERVTSDLCVPSNNHNVAMWAWDVKYVSSRLCIRITYNFTFSRHAWFIYGKGVPAHKDPICRNLAKKLRCIISNRVDTWLKNEVNCSLAFSTWSPILRGTSSPTTKSYIDTMIRLPPLTTWETLLTTLFGINKQIDNKMCL